jgi:hypothetical protein
VIHTYGADRTGTVSYRFNSLGFRGEEFRPEARKHVFVSGSSTSFGTGVAEEATWPHCFKAAYAEGHELRLDDVNLMNFSAGGASSGHAVRVAVSQCARFTPDLVLVELAPGHFRTEYLSREVLGTERHVSFGPWMLEDDGRVRPDIVSRHPELTDAISGWLSWYSEDTGVLGTVKEALLLQLFCRARGIPYLICWGWGNGGCSAVEPWRHHLVIGPLLELVDRERVFPFAITDRCIDHGADGFHPGPRTCRAYGDELWIAYEKLRLEGRQ